jgi:MFS family permease
VSSESEQGSVMGIMSSAISLASVVGPIVGGALFAVSPRGSYLVALAVALGAAALASRSPAGRAGTS